MMTRLKKTILNICLLSTIAWILVVLCMSQQLQEILNCQLSFGLELIAGCYLIALPIVLAIYGIGFFLTERLMAKELEKSDIQTYRLLTDSSAIGMALIRFCWTEKCKKSEENIDEFFLRHRALRLFDKRYTETGD